MIDLTQTMHDAARTRTAQRPAMAAGPVLQRIRRRRATRTAVQGTVGVAAAGAVAFAGMQLAGRGGPAPTDPAGVGWPAAVRAVGEVGSCGSTMPAVDDPAGDADVRFEATIGDTPVPAGGTVGIQVDLVIDAPEGFFGYSRGMQLLVTQGGTVVAAGEPAVTDPDILTGATPGGTLGYPLSQIELVACGTDGDAAEPLPGGSYDLWAVETFDAGPGTTAPAGSDPLTVAGGPWAFTIETPAATEGTEETQAPPETAEPTGPPALADLMITTAGLGPVGVGGPVPAEPGPADAIRWDPTFCEGTSTPERWVAAYPEQPGIAGVDSWPFTVWEDAGRVERVDVLTPGPRTSGGVGVGSTLDELVAAHPEARLLAGPEGEPLELWGFSDTSGTVVFEVLTDALASDVPPGTIVSVAILAADYAYGLPTDYPLGYSPAYEGDVCG